MSTRSWPCGPNGTSGSVLLFAMKNKRDGYDRADELRVSGLFVQDERGVYCTTGYAVESVTGGHINSAIDWEGSSARSCSINSLGYNIGDIARRHLKVAIKPAEIAPEIRRAVALIAPTDPIPPWVAEWVLGLADDEVEATASPAFDSEPAKVVAAPVSSIAPLIKEVAKVSPPMAEFLSAISTPPATIHPTHFRGVLLRPASDWSAPSAEGVFVGVSNEAYHACPSLSGTAAAKHMKSPAHSRLPFDGAARSRDIGTLVHGDILEGKDAAALGFAVVEGKTTTKPNTVTTEMVAIAKACAAALREDPTTALVATLPGLRELSCRARCPESGLMLRCRFDLAPETMGWAWDIKTTSAEDPGAFDNSFGEFGYAVSGAHYLRVATLVGLPLRAMRYACVSTSAPHETWVKTFGPIPGCEDLFPLAMSAAINAAKAEAHGRATGEWKKRRHEPSVAELKPWHLTALRQLANGEGVPY